MEQKTPHEPDADVMNAEEALDDAQKLSHLLRQNFAKTNTDPLPLSVLLDSVEKLNRSELQALKTRVEQRLAI